MINFLPRASQAAVAQPRAGVALVVEDQPLIRQAWVEWLRSDGWQTAEAGDVNDAISAAAATSPAVAVCDVSLGAGKSGVWLASQLLASTNPPQIIYATSHDMLPGNETLRPGVSGYLLKPFGKHAFLSAVTAAESEFLACRRRAGAEHALRLEVVARRTHLYARIDRLENWERQDASTIAARLMPFGQSEREALAPALAERAGTSMGLTGPERLTLMRAVELRNLGKLVLPGTLLETERPLAAIERQILASYVFESEAAIVRCGFNAAAAWVGAMAVSWDSFTQATAENSRQPEHGPSLMRVINVYLAMTEDRPYRPAFSSLDAVEHLRRGAGFLYSPAAVDGLIAALATRPI